MMILDCIPSFIRVQDKERKKRQIKIVSYRSHIVLMLCDYEIVTGE